MSKLSYCRLGGGEPAGKVQSAGVDAAALGQAARAGIERLVARFDDADTAYISRARPGKAQRYSDYEHLARVKEWAAGEEEAE